MAAGLTLEPGQCPARPDQAALRLTYWKKIVMMKSP